MPADRKSQVVVIGGGPAGYAAAFMAADLGLDVLLLDPEENPGGVCLYRGCIPSKALLHVAKLIREADHAREWGVTFAKPKLNLNRLRSWKNEVVDRLTAGVGQLVKQRKFEHLRASGKFQDNHTLLLHELGGAEYTIAFDYAIIATGSYPSKIPIQPDSPRILDSTTALDLPEVPGSLLVIGGGYIGLELGTVYSALGAKVTVVEMTDGLLPGVDRDLVGVLAKQLDNSFEAVMLNTTVKELKAQTNGIKVTLEGEKVEKKTRLFDYVLVSVGRRPNSGGIGLEKTKVETDKRGFVVVDAQRRTAEPHIFAVGDVAGEPMLAHKGTHEGRVAAEVIAGHDVAFDPAAVPAVVFTDPEIAWAGVTETEAKAKGINVEITKFPWAASGRAITLSRTDGLTKLLIDPETERILGVGIAGINAGEMIAEGVLAIEMAATVRDLGLSIHPHPTLTETLMESADMFHGTATHYYRPKRKKK